MNEKGMWESLRPHLQNLGLDPVRVENVVNTGTPDVNYTRGWIELKYMEAWPARASTVIKLPKFSPQQAAWLTRRWRAGGAAWVMLRVGHDLLLFSGFDAPELLRGKTQDGLRRLACWGTFSLGLSPHNLGILHDWLQIDADALSLGRRAHLSRLLSCVSVEGTAQELSWPDSRIHDAQAGIAPWASDLLEHFVC